MATVTETPTGAGVNREKTLMVTAMNRAIGSQALPTLYGVDQIARRQPVEDFSLPGGL
jgi:hypothetical protein